MSLVQWLVNEYSISSEEWTILELKKEMIVQH